MAGIIIEARVQQKTDTESAWMANELPLLPGECAFVAPIGGAITNFKVNTYKTPRLFSELPYIFTAALQVPFFGSATPDGTPEPATGDGFWIALTAGTYTNYGGVVLPASSLGVIARVGVSYSITTIVLSITTVPEGITNTGYGNIDKLWGAYPNKASANSAVPNIMVSGKPYREGKFVAIGDSLGLSVYWWQGGYEDAFLTKYVPDWFIKKSENLLDNAKLKFGHWTKFGEIKNPGNVLRTPLIPIDPSREFLTFSGGRENGATSARFVFFSSPDTFISYSDDFTVAIPNNARYVGVTIANSSVMGSDPTNTQFKETAMLNYGTVTLPWDSFSPYLDLSRIKNLDTSKLVKKDELFTAIGKNKFDKTNGVVVGKVIRVATGLIEDRTDSTISKPIIVVPGDPLVISGVDQSTRTYRFNDISGNPIKAKKIDGSDYIDFGYKNNEPLYTPPNAVSFQFMYRYNNIGDPNSVQVEFNTSSTAYEPYSSGKIPASMIAGEVGTGDMKSGGTSKTGKQLDDEIQTNKANISTAITTANSANTIAMSADGKAIAAQNKANSVESQLSSKVFPGSQIAGQAIDLSKLTQSLIDYINASGGASITNQPDEEDLTKVGSVLKLKDGADGYARPRLKSTASAQVSEFIAKAAYGYVLVKDVMDLTSVSGGRTTLVIPDGTTIKFVGNGMIKNGYIYGKNLKIEAGRKKIFENCQLFLYSHSGSQLMNNVANPLAIDVPNTFASDLFDKKNKVVILGASAPTVNPINVKAMHAKMAGLADLTLEGGLWKLKVGGTDYFTLTSSGANVVIPVSDKYIFFKKSDDSYLTGGTVIAPADVKGTYLTDYSRTKRMTIVNVLFPEWWGALADDVTDSTDAFNMVMQFAYSQGGATIDLSNSGVSYRTRGGIVAHGNVYLKGNLSTIKMLNNSTEHMIIHDNIRRLLYFSIDNIILDGNRANQSIPLSNIWIDWNYGQPFYTAQAGYNWSESSLYNVHSIQASEHGFYAGVPGDVTLTNCRASYNSLDGFNWEKEHFKLIECMAWYNDRDAVNVNGGNHWSIIGGKFAHSGRHGINANDAFEFQIDAVAIIDSVGGDNLRLTGTTNMFMITNVRSIGPANRGIYVAATVSKGKIIGVITKSTTVAVVNDSATVEVKEIVN